MELSIAEARQIILQQQLLSGFNGATQEAIKHLGYIQIDSINVIERAHNHILWSRNRDFLPGHLSELHHDKKEVFEYWAHAMSYLPTSDYRYVLPIMKRFKERADCREILADNKGLVKEIRKRVAEEGPLSASDFTNPKEFQGGGWWNRKPAKQVLEVLYWQGELAISHRKNFKRFYDLTERVLKLSKTDKKMPSVKEVMKHHIAKVLRTLGVACKADLTWFVRDKSNLMLALEEMLSGEQVQIINLEGQDQPFYALSEVLNNFSAVETAATMHILSPFDNMVIRRDFVKRMFNFDFVFECYVPQAKRRFGYFSCPILSGLEIIGTIDCKADRAKKELIIKNLHLNTKGLKAKQISNLLENLSIQVKEFSQFNGCNKFSVECQNKDSKRLSKILE